VNETAFPLRIDGRGRTSAASTERHVADLVEAVLFTAPGERVNRPDFGCGLRLLLFAPVDDAVAGAAEMQMRSGLQHWLGDVIELGDVTVELADTVVRATVQYRIRATGAVAAATFERSA
jgi:phage baseplate assembly protein W